VALEGVDAVAFAQAQFANDIVGLASGHWHWNAWLTPKGRVIAVFALLKLAEDRLVSVLLDHPADEFIAQLRRFVFRRKLKIEALTDWQVSGALDAPEIASGAQIAQTQDRIELDFGGQGGPRCLRLAPDPAALEPSAAQAWVAYDLRHGLPRLSAAQREQWTPQQLSLDRLQAYSVKKGCYPGQEIVARTHFLGKPSVAWRCLKPKPWWTPARPSAMAAAISAKSSALYLAKLRWHWRCCPWIVRRAC
jgi:tRNA-modifying protein YgfZ